MNESDSTYTLSFRLDFYDDRRPLWDYLFPKMETDFSLDGTRSTDEISDAIKQCIYHTLGLKYHSCTWTDVKLTPEWLEKLIPLLEMFEAKKIAYVGAARLYESVDADLPETNRWFVVNTEGDDYDYKSFKLSSEYPECRADRYSPMLHIQNENCVSQTFKEIIECKQLSGLEFLWIEDKGKYAANQWYAAIATKPLGRGVDHPWLDLQTYKEKKLKPTLFRPRLVREREMQLCFGKTFRKGEFNFDISVVDSQKVDNQLIKRLLPLLPQAGYKGSINTVRRFLQRHTPDTDFAFIWNTWDDDELKSKYRELCFNQRVKEILLENHLIEPSRIWPLVVYDELPEGCEELDTGQNMPSPLLTEEELGAFRQKEFVLKVRFDSKEHPVRVATLKKSLDLLRKAKCNRLEDFGKRLTRKRADKLIELMQVKIPINWTEALLIANGGIYTNSDSSDCTVTELEKIDTLNGEWIGFRKKIDDDTEEELTYFAETITGDVYAFEKAFDAVCEDVSVILISHEDFLIERRWPNIAEFLESILLE